MANRMGTTEANAREARNVGHQLSQSALKKVDSARASIEREIGRIQAAMSGPPEPRTPSAIAIETEIRGALSRMSREDRARTINDAIQRGDESVVGAALRGPSLLTGLGDAEREARRAQWFEKKFPRELDRMGRLSRARDAADRASQSLINFVASLTDAEAVRLAEESEREAREAIAAARTATAAE
jgi:hypothetical protein